MEAYTGLHAPFFLAILCSTKSEGVSCHFLLAMANSAWQCWTPANLMAEESKQGPKYD
jgi:hypothetical protein